MNQWLYKPTIDNVEMEMEVASIKTMQLLYNQAGNFQID